MDVTYGSNYMSDDDHVLISSQERRRAEEWECRAKQMHRFDVRGHLGDGTFGVVFHGYNHDDPDEEIAVKVIREPFDSWEQCTKYRELTALLALTKHPHIVQLYEVHKERDQLKFVFEYMPDGTLCHLIGKCSLRNSFVQSLTKQVLQGLAFLHAKGFVHRDLKPENLLLRGNVCKVADFGLARVMDSSSSPQPCTDYVSTLWYRAPEVLLSSPRYGKPIDLYAVGTILAEMYRRHPLFSGENELDQVWLIFAMMGVPSADHWPEGVELAHCKQILLPKVVDDRNANEQEGEVQRTFLKRKVKRASPLALDLLGKLLCLDPAERLTANSALGHSFFHPKKTTSTTSPAPRSHPSEPFVTSVQKRLPAKMVTASPGMSNANKHEEARTQVGVVPGASGGKRSHNTMTPFGSPTSVSQPVAGFTPINPYARKYVKKTAVP